MGNILGAIVDEDFSQNVITRQDTTNQVEKLYNSRWVITNFFTFYVMLCYVL
jgi:hypothetical protein